MRRTIETLRRARQRRCKGQLAYSGDFVENLEFAGAESSSSSWAAGSIGPKAAFSTFVAQLLIGHNSCVLADSATWAGVASGVGLFRGLKFSVQAKKERMIARRRVSSRITSLPGVGIAQRAPK